MVSPRGVGVKSREPRGSSPGSPARAVVARRRSRRGGRPLSCGSATPPADGDRSRSLSPGSAALCDAASRPAHQPSVGTAPGRQRLDRVSPAPTRDGDTARAEPVGWAGERMAFGGTNGLGVDGDRRRGDPARYRHARTERPQREWTMIHDYVIEEVRAIRAQLAAQAGYSVSKLCEEARRRPPNDGRPIVRLKPRLLNDDSTVRFGDHRVIVTVYTHQSYRHNRVVAT